MKSLAPVKAALDKAGVAYRTATLSRGDSVLYCYDPDANELMFMEDPTIQVIKEDMINNAPMLPWTRLW